LVDAVAELARVGLLDTSGRFVPEDAAVEIAPALADRLTTVRDGERVFVLHRPTPDGPAAESVYLSQRDVRELQFAKAAIATGWALLLEELEIDPSEVQQVLLAGSFGSYLSAASAIRIGLVPKLPIPRIISAGNVAGEGAKMAVLSRQERHAGRALIDEIEYVELSDRTDFNDRFVEQLAFPQ
ncbi:MAG: ASKHA domain-containing protein, partial [Actinomycetota bacterium]